MSGGDKRPISVGVSNTALPNAVVRERYDDGVLDTAGKRVLDGQSPPRSASRDGGAPDHAGLPERAVATEGR
jgi:hypothetical protein